MPVVTLAGITFNDGPDADGDEFVVSDVEGWDSPGVELVIIEKPLSDGAVIGHGRRAARSLGVTGYVIGETVADVGRARRKLATAINGIITDDGTLVIDEGDATYSLTVRLAAPMRTRQHTAQSVRFDMSLVAADPAKTLVP